MTVGRIQSLQVLRFVAASLVIVLHASRAFPAGPSRPLTVLGPMGVDLFFVLSGYIITTTAQGLTPAGFLWRRLTRILPIYYILTLAWIGMMAMGGVFAPDHMLVSFLLAPIGNSFHYLNSAWTLDYEMLFYAAFALALAFPRRGAVVLLAMLALALAARPVVGGWFFDYVGNPLIVEFLLGVAAAKAGRSPAAGRWALAGSLAAVALAACLGSMPDGWARVAILGAPCALIVYGAAQIPAGGAMQRVLARLGDASYAAYLVHQFPVIFLQSTTSPLGALSLVIVATAVSWLLGLAIHAGIERPLLAFWRRQAPRGVSVQAA